MQGYKLDIWQRYAAALCVLVSTIVLTGCSTTLPGNKTTKVLLANGTEATVFELPLQICDSGIARKPYSVAEACYGVAESLANRLPESYPTYIRYVKKACGGNEEGLRGAPDACDRFWEGAVRKAVQAWNIDDAVRKAVIESYRNGRVDFVPAVDIDWLADRLEYWCKSASSLVKRSAMCNRFVLLSHSLGVGDSDMRLREVRSVACDLGSAGSCKKLGMTESEAAEMARAGDARQWAQLNQRADEWRQREQEKEQARRDRDAAMQSVVNAANVSAQQAAQINTNTQLMLNNAAIQEQNRKIAALQQAQPRQNTRASEPPPSSAPSRQSQLPPEIAPGEPGGPPLKSCYVQCSYSPKDGYSFKSAPISGTGVSCTPQAANGLSWWLCSWPVYYYRQNTSCPQVANAEPPLGGLFGSRTQQVGCRE